MRTKTLSAAVAFAIAVISFTAQSHEIDATRLGVVTFPIACDPKAQPAFNRGAALMYNFLGAQHGLASACLYAKLAPDSPHALHMPSHIFTRLGLWEESIETNLRSAKSCDTLRCALHALDYAAYAYLQLGRDAEAKKIMDRVLALAAAEPAFVAAYAQAAVPARYALERGNWADAAAQSHPPRFLTAWAKVPQAESVLVFARGLGAARSGDTANAKNEIARLTMLRETLITMKEPYWAEQAEIQSRVVAGWTARAEGRNDEAVKLLREAADREDVTSKHIVTPGPIAPARELLAELLMDLEQPKDALREFTKAMEREPGRLRTIYGAGLAAERSGDKARAKAHYKQLVLMTRGAERSEILQSKEFLARN